MYKCIYDEHIVRLEMSIVCPFPKLFAFCHHSNEICAYLQDGTVDFHMAKLL